MSPNDNCPDLIIRSYKKKNCEEFLNALKLLNKISSDFDNEIAYNYLENVNYLISLKSMSKPLENCYTVILISMLVCDYSFKTIEDKTMTATIRKETLKVSNILSKIYIKSEPYMKIPLKIEKKTHNLLNSIRKLITSKNLSQNKEIFIKLKVLSKILSMAINTPFALILSAIKNLIKNPTISNFFPCFANEISPYLPIYNSKSYTLVLDLDETLIHVKDNILLIRP